MIQLRFLAEAALCRTVIALSHLFPRRYLLTAGGWAGLIFQRLSASRRRLTRENLRNAMGEELTEAERERIARACWRNLGRSVVEILCFGRFGRHSLGRIVHHQGLEHIQEAYARKRGVLLFSAHFGNWELSALMQGYLDLPLGLVTRPLDNPRLERLLSRLRCRSGNHIIHKRNAVRGMLKVLKAGGGVAIVIDQDARDHGVFVPFFHQLASTTPTLARMAIRTGAVVVPTFSVPEKDGSYTTTYLPPLEFEYSGERDEDAIRLTSKATKLIEEWVRRHPEHWFGWIHRRWKTLPPELQGEAPAVETGRAAGEP